jgi:transmembrane sensor
MQPQEEAQIWVARMTSGHFTQGDAEAFERWRTANPGNARAFAEASRIWRALTEEMFRPSEQPQPVRLKGLSRRAVLGGALAASAAGAVVLAVRPPLDLWPSFGEINADYRTATGERKQLTLVDGASVELNTRTSINILDRSARNPVLSLIAGEIAIAANGPLVTVAASDGQVSSDNGRFMVRHDEDAVLVSCLEGEVEVERGNKQASLSAARSVSFSLVSMSAPREIEPDLSAAWLQGLLIFRNDPLQRIVTELNRYRRGRILLFGDIGRIPVFATFRIDDIERAPGRLAAMFDLPIKYLPAGFVLLG